MPKTFTDQTATATGTPLNASNLNGTLTSADIGVATTGVPGLDGNSHVLQQPVYDATEAATNDTLGSTSTVVNNLNRLRFQLATIYGAAWSAGIALLDASKNHLVAAGARIKFVGQTGTIAAPTANQGICSFHVASGTTNGATLTVTNSQITTSSWPFISAPMGGNNLVTFQIIAVTAGQFTCFIFTGGGTATTQAMDVPYELKN